MSTAPPLDLPSGALLPGVPADLLKRFTVAEYHTMIQAGVFAQDENYELLEGWLVHKIPKHPPHWIATGLLRDALQSLSLSGYFVHSQDPITTKDSEPEPDLAIVRGNRRDYRGGNPDPRQAPFVVEVADSSLVQDRGIKKRIYARARIPVYWIVNLIDLQIEIYTLPSGPTKEVGRIKVRDILP